MKVRIEAITNLNVTVLDHLFVRANDERLFLRQNQVIEQLLHTLFALIVSILKILIFIILTTVERFLKSLIFNFTLDNLTFDFLDLFLYFFKGLQRFNLVFQRFHVILEPSECLKRCVELIRILKLLSVYLCLFFFEFELCFLLVVKMDLIHKQLLFRDTGVLNHGIFFKFVNGGQEGPMGGLVLQIKELRMGRFILILDWFTQRHFVLD